MDILLWAFVFYTLGILSRTIYGFLAKIIETPEGELKFDIKYWATFLVSILMSFVAGAATFGNVSLPSTANLTLIFLTTYPLGYLINDATNRGVNILTTAAANKASGVNG